MVLAPRKSLKSSAASTASLTALQSTPMVAKAAVLAYNHCERNVRGDVFASGTQWRANVMPRSFSEIITGVMDGFRKRKTTIASLQG